MLEHIKTTSALNSQNFYLHFHRHVPSKTHRITKKLNSSITTKITTQDCRKASCKILTIQASTTASSARRQHTQAPRSREYAVAANHTRITSAKNYSSNSAAYLQFNHHQQIKFIYHVVQSANPTQIKACLSAFYKSFSTYWNTLILCYRFLGLWSYNTVMLCLHHEQE